VLLFLFCLIPLLVTSALFARNIRLLLTRNPEITTPANTLTYPTLLITSSNFITAAMNFPEQMRPLVHDLRVENVTGGHWLQLEKPDEVNKILEEFMTEKRQV
jgi:soluble epoxide hydrolase/lipid-phosphate phosphatase